MHEQGLRGWRSPLRLYLLGVMLALVSGLGMMTAQAATVCCYRYADATSTIRNQVLYSPSNLTIDWSRAYLQGNGGGLVSADTRVVTPGGTWSATSGGWTWFTADPPGEPAGSRARCNWTSSVPVGGSIPIVCEIKWTN